MLDGDQLLFYVKKYKANGEKIMSREFERVRRLSRRMRAAVTIGGAALALAGAFMLGSAIVAPETFRELAGNAVGTGAAYNLTASSTVVLMVLFAVQFAILLYAVWCVWRMFGELAQDEPLSRAAAGWMQRGSVGFLAAAIVSFLATPIGTVALTLGNPPGERELAIGVGSTHLLALLIAAIMFMTSRILALAAEIRDDQKAIV